MSLAKTVAGTAVGLGSLALVGKSAKMVKDSLKNPKSKDLTKDFVDLTIGTALLVPASKLVNEL